MSANDTHHLKIPASVASAHARPDEDYAARVRMRFERDFLPRFEPLWRKMLATSSTDKENDENRSNAQAKPADATVKDKVFSKPTTRPPVNFLKAIEQKKTVHITTHDQYCECGCTQPILEDDLDKVHKSSSDECSNSTLKRDDADSIDSQSRSENSDNDSRAAESTKDTDYRALGDDDVDDNFNMKKLLEQLPISDEIFTRKRITGDSGRRFQLVDTDDEDDEVHSDLFDADGARSKVSVNVSLVDTDDGDAAPTSVAERANEWEIDVSSAASSSELDNISDVFEVAEIVIDKVDMEVPTKQKMDSDRSATKSRKVPHQKLVSGAAFRKNRDFLTRATFETFNRDAFDGVLGDVQITWSKKLNTTAGLTRLKRCKANMTPGIPLKRLAAIELSTKVVDSEERLRTTLLHELVHAAVWVVDGVDKPPHGPNFRRWANIAMDRIPGMEVTTTHSYAIEYKYIWRCSNPTCKSVVKRHSRSFNPSQYRCGKCKSPFVEAHPFRASKKRSHPSPYNTFVKEQSASVRAALAQAKKADGIQHPKISQADVMKECARLWNDRQKIHTLAK